VTALFEKSGTLLVCAAKCGITTFERALARYKVVENSQFDPTRYDRVIVSMREPLSRLLSAWRMYFVNQAYYMSKGDSNHLVSRDKQKSKSYLRYLRNIQPYSFYLVHPQGQFDLFMRSKYAKYLVRHDAHFQPQFSVYNQYCDLPNSVFVHSISNILRHFGCGSLHLHKGVWPWRELTVEDFRTAEAQRFLHKHYLHDLSMHKVSVSAVPDH